MGQKVFFTKNAIYPSYPYMVRSLDSCLFVSLTASTKVMDLKVWGNCGIMPTLSSLTKDYPNPNSIVLQKTTLTQTTGFASQYIYLPTYGSAPQIFSLCMSGGPHKNCLRAACGPRAIGCPPLVYRFKSTFTNKVICS